MGRRDARMGGKDAGRSIPGWPAGFRETAEDPPKADPQVPPAASTTRAQPPDGGQNGHNVEQRHADDVAALEFDHDAHRSLAMGSSSISSKSLAHSRKWSSQLCMSRP